jgi:putative DNA primase/helicase
MGACSPKKRTHDGPCSSASVSIETAANERARTERIDGGRMNAAEIASKLGNARRKGQSWRCRCPAHDDHDPSLAITERDGKLLVVCRAGCEQEAVIAALRQRDLWPKPVNERSQIIATYAYRDEHGALRYQVVRLFPKKFYQRRPNGSASSFINNMHGITPLPYRLPELLADPNAMVFIPEGEKDCDNLGELGLVATCNHGGAGKWRSEISRWLAGRHVVLLPDNDEPGRAHANDVTHKLAGIAVSVRVLELPGLPPKGDVSNWIAAGGTQNDLEALVATAEPFRPSTAIPATPDATVSGTEDAVALEFSTRHAENLRWVNLWRKWLRWEGDRWRLIETLWVFHQVRLIAREYAKIFEDKKLAKDAATAAIERAARNDPRHDTSADAWNLDTKIFNGAGITINLGTGEFYPARKEDYCTKIAAVAPKRLDIPLWRSFLDQVTGGDAELQQYLQRMAGYCMTGITSEHVMFFLYGTGANGKSVFINTLVGIWNDYAAVAPMTTFMASPTDQHSTDLAGLFGARLVVAQETEIGRHWAEAKIKSLTGGDKITARFMRADFFTYVPQLKLIIVGNHKPALRSVDEAIRRRIHLVPFTVTIPAAQRDRDLFEKLRAEWPGILAWATDGCREWQKVGLAPPPCVRAATDEYLADEDTFARWIDEECATGKAQWGVGERLWLSFKAWAERNNEWVGTRKSFAQDLKDRGYMPDKSRHVRGFKGINLKTKPVAEYDE